MVKKKKIEFNNSLRDVCTKCGFPHGFCKHTIEDEYKKQCPKSPIDKEKKICKESVWQMVRNLAMVRTQLKNISHYSERDITELRRENRKLRRDLEGYRWLEKQIEKKLKIGSGSYRSINDLQKKYFPDDLEVTHCSGCNCMTKTEWKARAIHLCTKCGHNKCLGNLYQEELMKSIKEVHEGKTMSLDDAKKEIFGGKDV
jgi:hypothetical protein